MITISERRFIAVILFTIMITAFVCKWLVTYGL